MTKPGRLHSTRAPSNTTTRQDFAMRKRRMTRPVMGDIGEPVKHIELEPFPESVPVQEPTPAVVPVPDREEVPA